MAEQEGYIKISGEELHYLKWGNGARLLLAFHGYANDAGIFQLFDRYLNKDFTIISIDLPHHGKSRWTENTYLSLPDVMTLVSQAMEMQQVKKISLLGYSMGGRVCLNLIEHMPEQIEKVILIAPDGLVTDTYYYLLTRTRIGKRLFKHFLTNHQLYFKLIDWMKDKKLVDASRHKFVMQYMHTEERRKFLWQVWPCMSKLMPTQRIVKQNIAQYKIPVLIFMGAYDKVIPPSLAKKFVQGLETAKLYVLQKGHRVFDTENAGEIAQIIRVPIYVKNEDQ